MSGDLHSRLSGLLSLETSTRALSGLCEVRGLDFRPQATLQEAIRTLTARWTAEGRMFPGAYVTPRAPDLQTYDRLHTFQPGELLIVEAVTPPPSGLCGVHDPKDPQGRRGYVAPWQIRFAFTPISEADAFRGGAWVEAADMDLAARVIAYALDGTVTKSSERPPPLAQLIVRLEEQARRDFGGSHHGL